MISGSYTTESYRKPGRPSTADVIARSIFNRAGIVILSLATGMLTARVLHPTGRGELAAMTLWPLFLANATAMGTPSALIYYLRKQYHRRDELVVSALALVVLLGTTAALVAAWLLQYWLRAYSPEVVTFARIFLIAVPLWAMQITGQAALEALELFAVSNRVQLMMPVITLLGLLTCYGTDRLTPYAAAACYVVAIMPAVLTILVFLWLKRDGRAGIRVTTDAWRTLLNFGVRSLPLDLLDTLSLNMDQVLVIGLLAASEMGLYAVVLSLSRALLVFQAAVVMVLFPKAAGKPTDQILGMVGQAARMSLIVTGTCALVTGLMSATLIRAFYGAQYLAAVPTLRLLVAEVVLQGVAVLLSRGLMAAGRPGIVSIMQGSGLAVALPLMFVFIPKLGTQGAALALLCSTATRLVLLMIAVPRVLGEPLPRLLPGVADVRRLVGIVRSSKSEAVA